MPSHRPDIHQVSINQLQSLTGKSYRVVKAALAGLEPTGKDGRIPVYSPVEALGRIYQSKAESERERLDRARAEAQEMQNRVTKGQLAPVELLSDVLADVSSQIRSILGALPKRLKQSLPELQAKQIDIIRREISAAQRAMSECRPKL
jgi:hypothetical protein